MLRPFGTALAPVLLLGCLACASAPADPAPAAEPEIHGPRVHYLEIVTPDVDAVVAGYEAANGLEFGEPDAGLGGARTAPLPGGGLVGVRAPLRSNEEPVVRPYWLVDDIEAAVAAAEAAGAQIAHPPLLIPGHGTFAIYFLGGVQHGLWQVP
jgi:predicted enzyme related to lactoylglutathione lyase